MKKALITGVTGQDGSFLAEFLLAKGWEVYGLVRRSSAPNFWRIQHIKGLKLVQGDVVDGKGSDDNDGCDDDTDADDDEANVFNKHCA